MSHEISSMFYVGETPWHGLGTKLENRPTSAEAIVAAGLDWEVGLKPLCTYVPDENGNIGLVDRQVSHRATYSKKTGEILGVVGPSWTPLQNVEAFSFFDPFVLSGQAAYETAGSLRSDRRVWILAELAGDPLVIVGDDVVKKYLLLSNSHDGSLAIRVGFTPVRVVCANTLAMAHDAEASKLIKISHHRGAKDTLAQVGEIMNVMTQRFEATAEQYRALAAKGCDSATLEKYVRMVFKPETKLEKAKRELGGALDLVPEVELSKGRILPKVIELFEGGRGNALPGVAGTMWAAYNAVTEYIVHERGKDPAARLESAWFGNGHSENRRALAAGVELAGA